MTPKRDALGLLADAGQITHEIAIALRAYMGELKRAQLAGAALQGLLARAEDTDEDFLDGMESLAAKAVELADALLDALDEGPRAERTVQQEMQRGE